MGPARNPEALGTHGGGRLRLREIVQTDAIPTELSIAWSIISLRVQLSFADLDAIPAYVENDIAMIREVAAELAGPEGQLADKEAKEYAARSRRG